MTQAVAPTQVTHPWRAVARTALVVLIVVAAVLPELAARFGWVAYPVGAAAVAVASYLTKLLALAPVNDWLSRHFATSWLAAAPIVKVIEDAMTADTPATPPDTGATPVADTPVPDTPAATQDGTASAG